MSKMCTQQLWFYVFKDPIDVTRHPSIHSWPFVCSATDSNSVLSDKRRPIRDHSNSVPVKLPIWWQMVQHERPTTVSWTSILTTESTSAKLVVRYVEFNRSELIVTFGSWNHWQLEIKFFTINVLKVPLPIRNINVFEQVSCLKIFLFTVAHLVK